MYYLKCKSLKNRKYLETNVEEDTNQLSSWNNWHDWKSRTQGLEQDKGCPLQSTWEQAEREITLQARRSKSKITYFWNCIHDKRSPRFWDVINEKAEDWFQGFFFLSDRLASEELAAVLFSSLSSRSWPSSSPWPCLECWRSPWPPCIQYTVYSIHCQYTVNPNSYPPMST